ncbi:MAG: hypothetical protein RLZZ511_4277 [Cyanobacteriota bacterium]|jgi:hypothetical protein
MENLIDPVAKEFTQILTENSDRAILGFYDYRLDYGEKRNRALHRGGEYHTTLRGIQYSERWPGGLIYVEEDGSFWFTTPRGSRQLVSPGTLQYEWDGTTLTFTLTGKNGSATSAIEFGGEIASPTKPA